MRKEMKHPDGLLLAMRLGVGDRGDKDERSRNTSKRAVRSLRTCVGTIAPIILGTFTLIARTAGTN